MDLLSEGIKMKKEEISKSTLLGGCAYYTKVRSYGSLENRVRPAGGGSRPAAGSVVVLGEGFLGGG